MSEKKEKQPLTTVYLTEDIYFTIDIDNMTLYHAKEDVKRPIHMGYYTDYASMVKKATKIVMADKKKKMIMHSYLEELRNIQNELLTKLK
jgi:hypothetical protein